MGEGGKGNKPKNGRNENESTNITKATKPIQTQTSQGIYRLREKEGKVEESEKRQGRGEETHIC